MSDGERLSGAHDGMGAFATAEGNTVLIRNHELMPGAHLGIVADPRQQYDTDGKGGTTTLIISPDRRLIRQYATLAGTVRNCGGGTTPWGSWISCEEDMSTCTDRSAWPVSKPHGYNFEIPSSATEPRNIR